MMDIPRPFELKADLGFLYKSDQHERVFQETIRAIERREGLVCITGEPGTGKSLLCERILTMLGGTYEPVYISNPSRGPRILAGLKRKQGGVPGVKARVLIVDEAQHLDSGSLDEIKFLWNSSMADGSRLHVVLVGQPELADSIAENAPLAQRVGANLNLGRLARDEVLPYLSSRLAKGDMAGRVCFTQGAARVICRKARGVPRLVNRIAQLALERAEVKGKRRIGAWDIHCTASEHSALKTRRLPSGYRRTMLAFGTTGLLMAIMFALVLYSPSVPIEDKPGASPERYQLKLGPFVTRAGAENAAHVLRKDDFGAAVREDRLADGWVVYGVYLTGKLEKTQANRRAEVLRERYGFDSSLISTP